MIELNNKNKRNVFSGVGIALLLCALMVLMSWSATVSNGDEYQSSVVKKENSTDDLLVEESTFDEEADETGYNPETELLGFRTEHSKTYVTDSGTATVYSAQPLHLIGDNGQWETIDYDIVVSEHGYSLANAPVAVDFGHEAQDGFSIELSQDVELASGMNVAMVDLSPLGISLDSVNGMAGKGMDAYRINPIQTVTTQDVSIGGNEIIYPLSDEVAVVYTTTRGEVKQDIVINQMTPEMHQSIMLNGEDGYIGFYESMALPGGYYLSSNGVALSNVNLFMTNEALTIHNEIGKAIGSIQEPVVLESLEDKSDTAENGITYFLTVDETGSNVEIITAVEKSWLMSEDTSFPVSIDPTVTYNQDAIAYQCSVTTETCSEDTNGEGYVYYDYRDYGGADSTGIFPFTFTQDSRPVEGIAWSVDVYEDYWDGYGDVIIMEQCANAGWPSSNMPSDIYNPNACTGNALPPLQASQTTQNQIYTWDILGGNDGTSDDPAGTISPSCAGTICNTVDAQGNVIEGIFSEGGYEIIWYDSIPDGAHGASFNIEIREVDDGTGQPGPWTVSKTVNDPGFSTGYVTTTIVPIGYEMRIDYTCASWCYENTLGITQAVVGPTLPALTGTPPATAPECSPDCAPNGLESPTLSFTPPTGSEAVMLWDCGNIGCDYNQVYYRTAGDLGWTNYWDMCGDAGNLCNQLDSYDSGNDNIFFVSGTNYEFLVWDTQADTAAEQFSNGGEGRIGLVAEGTYGTGFGDPVNSRLNSLASSESQGSFYAGGKYGDTETGIICTSKVTCSSGTAAMISNAVNSGTYIELGIGWGSGLNSESPDRNDPDTDGVFYVYNVKLIVEHESTTPDTTPPVDMSLHYDGVNSYVAGARTLFLSVEDATSPIDTSEDGMPVLYYTINGGGQLTADSELVSSVCNSKEQTCVFSATTEDLEVGDTVDYYWGFQDAAYGTLLKPTQTPNYLETGVKTFTIADPANAPEDGTDMKIVTSITNVDAAYDSGGRSGNTETLDRQMTYYQSSGEYHFEFDLSRCSTYSGTAYPQRSCFAIAEPANSGYSNSASNRYPTSDDQGQWLVSWNNDDTSLCAPGACGGAADNLLILDQVNGGVLDVAMRYGAGDFILKYDSVAQDWIVTIVESSSIDEPLLSTAPGASTVANDATIDAWNFEGKVDGSVFGGSWLKVFSNLAPTGELRIDHYPDSAWPGEQRVYLTRPGSYATVDSWNPGDGGLDSEIFDDGPYDVWWHDTYGDGSNGWIEAYTKVSTPEGQNTYAFTQSGSTWENYGFPIDFSSSPNFVGQFGEITFGAGETASQMCVSTNGLIFFVDGTVCNPDARSLDNHNWQGFAIGSTLQGEQDVKTEMVYTIRNVAPDPDVFSPEITHTLMGDSHSLSRTVSALVKDVGYPADGLNVAPAAGAGPTVYYEVYQTGSNPTGVYTPLVMTPDLPVRADCALIECLWQADIPTLSRGQSVDYYIAVRDTSVRGTGPSLENVAETSLGTFDVGEPTNMLILEWNEYSATESSTQPCSMQVVLYDVTNEFEFHYDDSCGVNDIVGLTGHRKDSTDYSDIRNVATTDNGNPHSYNIRVTNGVNGYAYEYFDLGISNPGYLPQASSEQVIDPSNVQSFNTDGECASSTSFTNNEDNCAGNFDIPEEFSFVFYGTTYDGSDVNDRIHVAAEGVMHFIDDGDDTVVRTSGTGGDWPSDGSMDSLGVAKTLVPDNMIAPWYSRANMNYCYDKDGCEGVWQRLIPYDGNGINVNADIVDDTTWYAVDSPIKVNPTDPSGYLSVSADLTIEPGVEVLFAPGTGLSFDGGLQADGTCSQFTALGTSGADEGIKFGVNTEANNYNEFGNDEDKYWRGLAFTDECNGGEAERHQFANVEFSDTQHAAITAGSRPHDPSGNGPTCGTSNGDCNVGEFDLTDVSFNNVASAFKHGSGQGTQVTMHNFQVNNGRDACFNFAENTEATLTGTDANNPSTMTNCNTNWNEWGGAVISMPGSTSGSLTMSYVDIYESNAAAIRTDLLDIDIDNVNVYSTGYMAAWTGPGQNQDETGVSLGLGADATSTVSVTNFYAENYHHAYIYAAGSINLDTVNLGVDQYFDVRPYGKNPSGAALGTSGANSMFTNVISPGMYVYRSFPMMDQMTINGPLVFDEMGGATDTVSITNSVINGKLTMTGCGVDIEMSQTSINALDSLCFIGGVNSLSMVESTIDHSAATSAVYLANTDAYLQELAVTSSTIDNDPGVYMVYADSGSIAYLIASTYESAGSGVVQDCASSAGSTGDCQVNAITGGAAVTDVFFGGFANGLAYRQGLVNGAPGQIPQSNAILTATALDSTGAAISDGSIGSATTDANGQTTKLPVITGNYAGDNYQHQHIRASGAAGFGEAHPTLSDGTAATMVTFQAGQAVTPPVPFDTFTIGDSVDIRLTPPPVTLDYANMNCAFMSITDPNDPAYDDSEVFRNAYDPVRGAFVFKGFDLGLDADLAIDGCTVILEGSKLVFMPTNSPSVTISSGGALIMDVDTDTGDLPKVMGQGGTNDVVDLTVANGGLLDVNAGSISNLAPTSTKTGLLVVQSGGVLDMTGGSSISAPDITGLGSNFPIVHLNGGIFNADTVTIAADGKSGAGVYSSGGILDSVNLEVSNAETGIVSDYATVILNQFTSTDNTNGVVSIGSMSLPKYYSSLDLDIARRGLASVWQDYDYWHGPSSTSYWSLFDWNTKTVDLSAHIGQTDFFQPQLRMTYNGMYAHPVIGGMIPFVELDNLEIIMEDASGNSWIVDDSTDVGYYPYSANDPASGNSATAYAGGVGGVPNWDCSYSAISSSPYNSFGSAGPETTALSTGIGDSMGELYGTTGYGYPEEFGFRYTQATKASYPSDQSPTLLWGMDHVTDALMIPLGYAFGDTSMYSGDSANDVCQVAAANDGSTLLGTDVDLEFPIIDISDASIEKVYLRFDMYHMRDANGLRNALTDNVQVMTRGADDPANMGEYSELLPGQGMVINGATITGSNVGVNLAETVGSFTNVVVTDPSSVGLKADGYNSIMIDGLTVTDSVGSGLTSGVLMMPAATGVQEITNSNFDGVNTAIALNNDVSTRVSSTTISNVGTGISTGAQSSAAYFIDGVTMTNVETGVLSRGTGEVTMTDTSITSTTNDVVMSSSGSVTFVDGLVDETKIDISSTGTFFRDRSYVATLTANGAPVDGANVILSSRDAVKTSFGKTDANGETSGLTFAIYSMDANQVTDFRPFLNTYELNSIAAIAYDWTSETVNTGDFRYIFTSAALQDSATDIVGGVNAESFTFVDNIDVRICSNSGGHTVIAPCAGTLADTDSRTYSDSIGMVEYGSEEALFDASLSMDLSDMAIMVDSGILELRDGMTYNFDNSVIMQTGYETIYNLGQWYSEEPYGTVIEMDGGSVNVLTPESPSGQPVGLSIGGKLWTTDSPVGFDINNVQFNGIASISSYNGNYEENVAEWGGYSDYQVPVFSLTDSYLNHYRGYRPEYQNFLYDVDMCVRIGGGINGVIDGNSFSDCTVGVLFDQSDWNIVDANAGNRDTTLPHTQIGANAYSVTNNDFTGGAGFNVWFYYESSATSTLIQDNTMSCDNCIAHVSIYDGGVLFPKILGNTMTNGETGVYSNAAEHLKIDGNVFNNIETVAVWVVEGDADITNNQIYNSGGAIIADSMEKPVSDAPFRLVAGMNTDQPNSASFTDDNWDYSSDDITFTLADGEEMVMEYSCSTYCDETTVRVLTPLNTVYQWTQMQASNDYDDWKSIDINVYFDEPGTYTFNVDDSWGDGPNGGEFYVYAGDAGTWTAAGGGVTTGVSPSISAHPDYYTAFPFGWSYYTHFCGYYTPTYSIGEDCVSNRYSTPILWQNNDAITYDYEFTALDSGGDGMGGSYYYFEIAPVGTFGSSWNAGSGTFVGGIYTPGEYFPYSTALNVAEFNYGSSSDVLEISLDPGMEMRFVMHCGDEWYGWLYCSEQSLSWEETILDPTWVGPDIDDNLIENIPSSSNFDPLAFGIQLTNCDMTSYSVYTTSNVIKVGNEAIVASGCIWQDTDSQLIGFDVAGSVGFDDDNAFATEVSLDGTQISGYETGLIKTGGKLFITDGTYTASGDAGTRGIYTDGIEVSVIGATVDGGTDGTGMVINNSPKAWLYPMDATGHVGVTIVDSEIEWDAGNVDADTILEAYRSTGYVTDLTDTGTGTQIDANEGSLITTVGYSLDETRMAVDDTSIVHESNYLTVDANHLGDEPSNVVGMKIISDQNYAAYQSSTFTYGLSVDGALSDWYGPGQYSNELNPSGYATPGSIGGPMWVATDDSDLFLAFDGVDTSTDDIYVYFNTNDIGGIELDLNDVNTLPFGAEYALKITEDATSSSATTELFARDVSDAWQPAPSGAIGSDEADVLEVSVPLTSLLSNGGSMIDMVAIVVNAGTFDEVTQTSPVQPAGQAGPANAGPVTLTDSYRIEVGDNDLYDGTLYGEILLHRSFMYDSTPTAAHNYNVMVKTKAAPSNCQFDWAETMMPLQMNTAQSLTFDILRACPVITNALQDIVVLEDSTGYTFDLATFVDDEQDDETTMEWSVVMVSGSQNTYLNEDLSDWADLSNAVGSQTIIPAADKHGTFELKFEVTDIHGQKVDETISYTVSNVNDKPIICDLSVDADCSTQEMRLSTSTDTEGNTYYNVRTEDFGVYSQPLGEAYNSFGTNSPTGYIVDLANENVPDAQKYQWSASASCDQFTSVSVEVNALGLQQLVVVENPAWEQGGVCDITLDLIDDGVEFCFDTATGVIDETIAEGDCTGVWMGESSADSVVVPFSVAPLNDAPVIATGGTVPSADGSNQFIGDTAGNYRVTLVEDTTDVDQLSFDLSSIKSDLDHELADLTWTYREGTGEAACSTDRYFSNIDITGDTISFELIPDATTNAERWEVDMLNNLGYHQYSPDGDYCEIYLKLSDTETYPSYMPNYEAVEPNLYEPKYDEIVLSVKVDNVPENVPDYYFDATEGFDFNGVSNIMPGTFVPVDFTIHAGGDEGPYNYNHVLVVDMFTNDGYKDTMRITPPAYGDSHDVDDWEVYISDATTEVWLEMDVVTLLPTDGSEQGDSPESHRLVQSNQVFSKWSAPGAVGSDADATTADSDRRPAFEDKNWCNNMMSTNGGVEVGWSAANQCQHSEQGYNGAFAQPWENAGNAIPTRVSTIGALSVASFAPSIVAVALTGLFVSALVLAGRRDDDEEEFVKETISDDESAVSPVIATILMVAITVVLSGVVYVWAAQLADTDTKGVPRVTFSAENVDTGNLATDHWKITVGQAQTVLATQAVEITVTYTNGAGDIVSETTNLASTNQVYGFSPFNSNQLVTFGDVVTLDDEETISSFSTGDDIYVKTHDADGTPLVDATIRIVYNPPGDTQGAVLKTYTGLTWNQPV